METQDQRDMKDSISCHWQPSSESCWRKSNHPWVLPAGEKLPARGRLFQPLIYSNMNYCKHLYQHLASFKIFNFPLHFCSVHGMWKESSWYSWPCTKIWSFWWWRPLRSNRLLKDETSKRDTVTFSLRKLSQGLSIHSIFARPSKLRRFYVIKEGNNEKPQLQYREKSSRPLSRWAPRIEVGGATINHSPILQRETFWTSSSVWRVMSCPSKRILTLSSHFFFFGERTGCAEERKGCCGRMDQGDWCCWDIQPRMRGRKW